MIYVTWTPYWFANVWHYSSCNVWIFRVNFKMCSLQYCVLVSRNKMQAQIYVCQNNIAMNMYAWSRWNNFTFSRFISHCKKRRATVNVYRISFKEEFQTSKIKESFTYCMKTFPSKPKNEKNSELKKKTMLKHSFQHEHTSSWVPGSSFVVQGP